jgi:hypothetical protein
MIRENEPCCALLADSKEEAKLSWYFRDLGSEAGIELGKIRLKKS